MCIPATRQHVDEDWVVLRVADIDPTGSAGLTRHQALQIRACDWKTSSIISWRCVASLTKRFPLVMHVRTTQRTGLVLT